MTSRMARSKGPASGIPASGIPARGTTRPPFPKGNALTLKHGARSPRVYEPVARQLVAGLVEDRPDLAAYPEAVAAWAQVEAQCVILRRHAAEVGLLDGDEPRKFMSLMVALERTAAYHRKRLGLDPVAEASLQRDRAETAHIAVDIEAILARGRAVAPPPPEDDPVTALVEAVQSEGEKRWREANEQHNNPRGDAT